MASRSSGHAMLTALAGFNAFEAGLPAEQVLSMGAEAQDPDETFTAALGIAALMAAELRRLGGDPDAILARVYNAGSRIAYSSSS